VFAQKKGFYSKVWLVPTLRGIDR